MGDISKHFSTHELACKCCGEVLVKPKFVDLMEQLRVRYDQPIHPTSWYRCPLHNRAIRGSRYSRHMYGIACDIAYDWRDKDHKLLVNKAKALKTSGLPSASILEEMKSDFESHPLLSLVLDMPFQGIGLAYGFVHVDSRTGPRVLWTY